MEERRIMRVYMAPKSLAQVFEETLNGKALAVITKGLPKGIKVVGMHIDQDREGFSLTVEHPSFNPVKEGEVVPQFTGNIEVNLVKKPIPIPKAK